MAVEDAPREGLLLKCAETRLAFQTKQISTDLMNGKQSLAEWVCGVERAFVPSGTGLLPDLI
jgi:hypothetical protein